VSNTFIVFGSPVAKQRSRTVTNDNGDSVTYTPRKTRDYESDVRWRAKAAHLHKVPGLVAVRLRMFGGRGDIDNVTKSVLDGMNKVVYDDDRDVEEIHCYLTRDAQIPRVEVTVGPKGSLYGDEVRAATKAIEKAVRGPLRYVDPRELAIAALEAARKVASGEAA
jgi:Holliday junction resolvase RusA-like endonuclease